MVVITGCLSIIGMHIDLMVERHYYRALSTLLLLLRHENITLTTVAFVHNYGVRIADFLRNFIFHYVGEGLRFVASTDN